MYKMALISLLTLSSLASATAIACEGEAQIIAPVAKTEQLANSCKVFVKSQGIKHFSANKICPIYLEDIMTQGVEITQLKGENCSNLKELNGVVLFSEGTLFLE